MTRFSLRLKGFGFVDMGRPLWRHDWFFSSQLILVVLASTIILGSEFRETRERIFPSQNPDTPNLECKVPHLYPPGTGRSS
jgi:hypothetical protein